MAALQQQISTMLGSPEESPQRPYTSSTPVKVQSKMASKPRERSFESPSPPPRREPEPGPDPHPYPSPSRPEREFASPKPAPAPMTPPKNTTMEQRRNLASTILGAAEAPQQQQKPSPRKQVQIQDTEPEPRNTAGETEPPGKKELLLPSQQRYEEKLKLVKTVETNLMAVQMEKKKVRYRNRMGSSRTNIRRCWTRGQRRQRRKGTRKSWSYRSRY